MTLCVATCSATNAAAPIADSTSVANRCSDRCFTQLAAAASTAVVFAAVLFAAVVRRAISQRRAFPTDCSDAAIKAVAFAAVAFAAVAFAAVAFAAVAFAAVAFAAVAFAAVAFAAAAFAAVALAAVAFAAVAFVVVAFAAVALAAVVRRAISQPRAFSSADCCDAAITAVAFATVALAAVVRLAISQPRAFSSADCCDAAITAAAVFAAGVAGCMLVTFDSSSIVPASFNRAHLAAEGPLNATGTIDVFCPGGLGTASVVATSDATSFPKGCRSVVLAVRLWLTCRLAAARRAAVFAAIALMSPVLGAIAGAAEVVCLDGRPASAPWSDAASVTSLTGGCASGAANMLLTGATADFAGGAHSQRSGGQMDGVLPQLLMHQLESCGALSELSAAQVVGSPPSTRAVGRRCRTEVLVA